MYVKSFQLRFTWVFHVWSQFKDTTNNDYLSSVRMSIYIASLLLRPIYVTVLAKRDHLHKNIIVQ